MLDEGPRGWPVFERLRADLLALNPAGEIDPAQTQHLRRRLDKYFVTTAGKPRQRIGRDLFE